MKKKAAKIQGLKAGFTLIELVIVMMIIALLTVVAIGSFGTVEKQARIDFATDTLVSVFREAQTLAKSGRRAGVTADSMGTAQCYAVKIVAGASEEGSLFTAQSDYIAIGTGSDSNLVDTCKEVNANQWKPVSVFDPTILITFEENTETEQIYYFKPPFAQIFQWLPSGLQKPMGRSAKFVVGAFDTDKFNNRVNFDLVTGTVKRLPPLAPVI